MHFVLLHILSKAKVLSGRFVCLKRLALFVSLSLSLATTGRAQVTYSVTFDDPEGRLAPYELQIESHIHAAGALWSERFEGISTLWLRVRPAPAFSGMIEFRAFTWSYVDTVLGTDIFETGASTHIRNGFPASSFDPDIEVIIDPDLLSATLWFESDPTNRTGAIDSGKLDAVSLFARELGECFCFGGWIDPTDGTFPGSSASVFDRLIVFDGTNFTFVGNDAVALYGAPVPLTFGAPYGLGNPAPAPGSNLLSDLMGGAGLQPETKYVVSELDWAMLRDARVPVRYPCPCDQNGDGFVDDADFVFFTADYDILDCAEPSMPAQCPSDFNRDAFVDDVDYVIFIDMYGNFICP